MSDTTPDPMREQTALEYSAKTHVHCPHCLERVVEIPKASYEAGWDARDRRLHEVLFGNTPAFDPVELALKAYAIGRNDESEETDEIFTRFEAFLKKVGAGPLAEEATELLAALEAAKE
jgi:hypothetical protein